MIDSHTHLNDPRLLPQVDALLGRMQDAGVTGALVVGYDIPSSRQAVALARQYPALLRAAVGMHPHDSIDLDADGLAALRALAEEPEVVAFGEIGLDYHYDNSPRAVQRDAFRRQIALAAELALPLVIHEREALQETMTILTEEGGWALGGSWHCCSVAPPVGLEIAKHFYLGIAGWITFPKSPNVRALVAAVPLDRLLIETDAPYITPVPHRGTPNEPSYVRFTAHALAQVKELAPGDVESITSANALRAFPRWAATRGG